MKKSFAIVASLLVLVSISLAQSMTPENIDRTMKGYLMALQSDNLGLRNDAIFQLTKVRATFPDLDMQQAIKVLRRFNKTEKNPMVRLHAELAIIYINNANISQKLKADKNEDSLIFFNRVFQELNSYALALQ